MSMWTHVAGIVRIDALRFSDEESNTQLTNEIKELLGTPKNYNEIEFYPDGTTNTKVPHGTEGSLNYEVRLNDDYDMLPAGYISIFGDLRNFGGRSDQMKIMDWIMSLSSRFVIRQATIQINDNYEDDTVIFYYYDGEWHEAN
jgi:hypothetical protein